MPGQDRTGPTGQGAMTGRGLGLCGRSMDRGLEIGRGRGFGWKARTMQVMPIQQPALITEKQEKEFLEQELAVLKEEMKGIEERIKKIKK